MKVQHVLVTGGTGYLGSCLVTRLLERGHSVRALVRAARPLQDHPNLDVRVCDVFNVDDVARAATGCTTFVHLIGTRKPAPWKREQFRTVDLESARVAAAACTQAGIRHIVYVSVARPAPVMRAYQEARAQAEAAFLATGIPLTVLRPWYVLGPGHRWALAMLPVYRLLERIPATRESAIRLGLVNVSQMLAALLQAVEQPSKELRIMTVPEITQATLGAHPEGAPG